LSESANSEACSVPVSYLTFDASAAACFALSSFPHCNFEGYDATLLMSETAKLRNLITKRGTLEILIPLCCTTNPVRHNNSDRP